MNIHTLQFNKEELDREEWKPVVGYEGCYEVSNLGRVKNRRNLILSMTLHGRTKEYFHVQFFKKGEKPKYFLVHRLVAELFIPNPEGKPCVNHLNNEGHDNRSINLEWVTYKENTKHGIDMGSINKNRSGMSTKRIDELQIRAIIFMSKNFSQREISNLLGIPETTVNSLIRRKII